MAPMPGKLVCPAYEDLGIPALYVHDLTGTEDAQRFLRRPLPIHPASPQVLPNLQRWNPEVASAFSEKSNSTEQIPFKLVTKHPTWNPSDITSFIAISYCWHSDEWEIPSRFSYEPPGWSFPFSPAMLKALLPVVPPDAAIWIDQLCIDQDIPEQKALAVANMDAIYRNAICALILLEDLDVSSDTEHVLEYLKGPANKDEDGTFDVLEVCADSEQWRLRDCLMDCGEAALKKGVEDIVSRRWFGRAWCFQEYYLNSYRIFLFIGKKYSSISLPDDFFAMLYWEYKQITSILLTTYSKDILNRFISGSLTLCRGIEESELLCLFFELSDLSCTFAKDIISIALNTCGISLSIDGNITSRFDTRFILTLLALAAGDLLALDSIGPPLEKQPPPSLHSIFRWPLRKGPLNIIDDAIHSVNPLTKIAKVTINSITLDMIFLSKPENLRMKFLPRIRSRYRVGKKWVFDTKGSTEYLAAAVLELDPSWWTDQLPHSRGMVEKILSALELVESPPRAEAESEDNLSLTSEVDELNSILWRLVVSFDYIRSCYPFAVRLNNDNTRRAVILVPQRLKEQIESKSSNIFFAVPAATLVPYTKRATRRLWILQAHETPDILFSRIGQGFYIGDAPVFGDEVTYVDDVPVAGRWSEDEYDYDSTEEWDNHPTTIPAYLPISWDSTGFRLDGKSWHRPRSVDTEDVG